MWARLDVKKPVRNLAQHSRHAVRRAGWRRGAVARRWGPDPELCENKEKGGLQETSEFSLYVLSGEDG